MAPEDLAPGLQDMSDPHLSPHGDETGNLPAYPYRLDVLRPLKVCKEMLISARFEQVAPIR